MATAPITEADIHPARTDQEIRDRLAAWQDRINLTGNHRYQLDGKYVEGVTTVLKTLAKEALIAWSGRIQLKADIQRAWDFVRANGSTRFEVFERAMLDMAEPLECRRQRDKAADIGTEVHALIEHYLKARMGMTSETPIASDAAHATYSGFEAWVKDVDFRPVAVETRLVSEKHGYCGTLDCLGWINGRLTVPDWKSGTGTTVYPEMRLQSAAYRMALKEMTGLEAEGYILKLPKDGGEISRHPLDDDVENTFACFLALLDATRRLKTMNRRTK